MKIAKCLISIYKWSSTNLSQLIDKSPICDQLRGNEKPTFMGEKVNTDLVKENNRGKD